jgi:hypothetical protein
VGAMQGELHLDTSFTTIVIAGGEVKKLNRVPGGQDVKVVLWDETSVTGQLQEQTLECRLKCGVTMKVPVALVEDYRNPRPMPTQRTVETIRKLVGELDAEKWETRDAAQKKLLGMGTVIIKVLQEMRPNVPLESQQRIDVILKDLEKEKPAGTGEALPAIPIVPIQIRFHEEG